MAVEPKRMEKILSAAAAEGRSALMEHEVYAFLAAAGCRVPRSVLVPPGGTIDPKALKALGGDRVMLKIVSPEIAHKTDVGGVCKVAANKKAVTEGIARMLEEAPRRFARSLEARPDHAPKAYRGLARRKLEEAIRKDIRGVLVVELVPCESEGVGSEVIFALRHNREFGPVMTMGVGGIDTELMGETCKKGLAVVSGSALMLDEEQLLEAFRPTLAYRRLAGVTRTAQRLVKDTEVLRVIRAFRAIAGALGQDGKGDGFIVTELEVNPFGASNGSLVALDGLLKFRRRTELPLPRPLASLEAMMRPQSLCVVGVSAKGMNMGRIILRNILEIGFPRERAYVLRPDCQEIEGVRCYPEMKDLPERVDLFVVAVGAEQVAGIMEELVEHDKAVGVIIIPGGMAEKAGGEVHEQRVRAALRKARELGRPLIANGGNCLGILSKPGRYHTIFVPKHKLPMRQDGRSNVALISQSGAYMISRISKLAWMSPRYGVSAGNQVDLTMADYLRHLANDREVTTFAAYVEGFKDGDGLEFAKAVEEVTAQGRDVIFYKAGRTAEGKSASSGHTASLAGDYDVCESIMRQAGALVGRTFEEYLDLLKLSSFMGQRPWRGRKLAALSNAGYETVGIADSLRGEGFHLELARYSDSTRDSLQQALAKGRLDALVDVRNPLDLTPMGNDEAHEDVLRAFFADPEIDLVLCSTVPFTTQMASLGESAPENESIRSPGSLVSRLARIMNETDKPIVVSVDAGELYDPMARAFEEKGLPTFRAADAAVRTMGIYLENRIKRALPAPATLPLAG